ncbi:type I 3-dehydroquinate dehydratase [Eubacteriaceae bacterium ES3]|nr:type I 3-dehydroquinate dehydratase [Eubacteriaceae bacterium ES3]
MNKINKDMFLSCIPLTGATIDEISVEIDAGLKQECDYFEWRRDYYRIDDKVLEINEIEDLLRIREMIGYKGLIYTFRGEHEGGVNHWPDTERLSGICFALKSGVVDYIDTELDNEEEFHQQISRELLKSETGMILSSHDFDKTPSEEEIKGFFKQMDEKGADVKKMAVKTVDKNDLHRILRTALCDESQKPLIVIGMGPLGVMSRVVPEIFGGSLTFAAGLKKTAPGQLTIAEILKLRQALGF